MYFSVLVMRHLAKPQLTERNAPTVRSETVGLRGSVMVGKRVAKNARLYPHVEISAILILLGSISSHIGQAMVVHISNRSGDSSSHLRDYRLGSTCSLRRFYSQSCRV